MLAQMRPDVARFAEESVANLKELETRIDVLKNDLAALCASIGHNEAARVALLPPRGVLPTAAAPHYPFASTFPAYAPFAYGVFPGFANIPGFPPISPNPPLPPTPPMGPFGTYGIPFVHPQQALFR